MGTHETTVHSVADLGVKGTRLANARAELASVLNGREPPAWLDAFATEDDVLMAVQLLASQTSKEARSNTSPFCASANIGMSLDDISIANILAKKASAMSRGNAAKSLSASTNTDVRDEGSDGQQRLSNRVSYEGIRLADTQLKLLDMLMAAKDVCSKAALVTCLKTQNMDNLKVQMRNLQLVLLPHRIDIEPIRGEGLEYVGYRMSETSKNRLRARIVSAPAVSA